MDAAGNVKGGRNAVGGEIEMSDALGRVGVAGDGIEEPHVEIACNFALPAGVCEIVQDSGNLERSVLGSTAVGRELKVVHGDAIALEVEVELQLAMHGRSLLSRQFAGEHEVSGGGIDAVAFGAITSGHGE